MPSILRLSHLAIIPNRPSTFPLETFKMNKSLNAVWPGAPIEETGKKKRDGLTGVDCWAKGKVFDDDVPNHFCLKCQGKARCT